MNNEAIFQYLIHDGEVYSTADESIVKSMNKKSVYEVIRAIDAVPLFFEEHIDRLYKSAEIINIKLCLTKQKIKQLMAKLMSVNNEFNSNIKLLFSEDGASYFLYFMHTFYPSQEMYKKGIHTVLYDVVRYNPNAKVNDYQLRKHIKEYRLERAAFEALLVNKHKNVTEGSRSNIFFVKDKTLYTAPNRKVLIGITRNKVIEHAKKLNIKVIERDISTRELMSFEGVFMTSTSNDILPITSIDDLLFESVQNTTIELLQNAYLNGIKEYVKGNK
ncbi:aminotransferase class IV family protein [Clostridium sp. 'deep sea']|uniref:aminotransferase class IV n=1 Tax=Clostridium sp. 'deep sea' TaxID=2779445 RepID=UPI0018964A57|nr:aminotransferase class IV [Clostridium sp. 'deep sea']QOR33973.1 aminotransferase class IV family protein [Clostridium sp. 'deep sea']